MLLPPPPVEDPAPTPTPDPAPPPSLKQKTESALNEVRLVTPPGRPGFVFPARRGSTHHPAMVPLGIARDPRCRSVDFAEPATAEAHAHFRLGQHLARQGEAAEAGIEFARATALHPDSWAAVLPAGRRRGAT